MPDYPPLITKAVTGLNAQDRRALYQRGRNVLLTELEAVSPPLRKSIISKELLAFEEAHAAPKTRNGRGRGGHAPRHVEIDHFISDFNGYVPGIGHHLFTVSFPLVRAQATPLSGLGRSWFHLEPRPPRCPP